MQSGLFQLNWSDFVKGLVVAVISAIIIGLGGIVMTSGFDAFKTDWLVVGQNMVNFSIVSLVSYLLKNLLTTSSGNVAGLVPTK
jgi:uncharacterized membrane-anchored protein